MLLEYDADTFIKDCKSGGIRIDSYDFIAFDIFDTILKRDVSPLFLYNIWSQDLIRYFELDYHQDYIVNLRKFLERILRIKNWICLGDKECNYRDLIALLYKSLKVNEDFETFYHVSLCIEKNIEIKHGYINPEWKRIYDYLINNYQCKYICISDYYLPVEVVQDIFKIMGVENIENIFISSDYIATKRSGALYSKVLDVMNTAKILMIGDNMESDCISAQQHGLDAFTFKSVKADSCFDNMNKTIQKSRNYLTNYVKGLRNIPFGRAGLLLYIFTEKLYNRLLKDGHRKVLFCSREGMILKRIFDYYRDTLLGLSPTDACYIESQYFYVSRKATFIPSLTKIDKYSFDNILNKSPMIDTISFFRNLNLDNDNEIKKEFQSIWSNEPIKGFKYSNAFNKIITSSLFKKKCREKQVLQYNYFIQYLSELDENYRENGLCIVDIGYSGTIQDNIQKCLGEDIPIRGYYMFLKSVTITQEKIGILYDINVKNMKPYQKLMYNNTILEALFSADHGSVSEYSLSLDGRVVPVFSNGKDDLHNYIKTIQYLHDSFLEIVKNLKLAISDAQYSYKDYTNTFYKEYMKMIVNHTKQEIQLFCSLSFVDNYANYKKYCCEGIKPEFSFRKGLLKTIQSKGEFLREQKTFWVAAAMYRAGLGRLNCLIYILFPFAQTILNYTENKKFRLRSTNNKEIVP